MLILQLLNESGGPIFSNILSTEPRNMMQVAYYKIVKKRKLSPILFAESDLKILKKLKSAPKDSSSPVHAILISGNSHAAFLYKNSWRLLICCDASDNKSNVPDLDATFKLWNGFVLSWFQLILSWSIWRNLGWIWRLQFSMDLICKLLQLYCARQFQQRDEKAIDSYH